jgi:hypothetical protein
MTDRSRHRHIYAAYDDMAPIMHLRRIEGADLFDP